MAVAGYLDPVELIATARPAAHALAALARLAERDLLGTAAVAELRALTQTHLGERERAWDALDVLLPEHRGTVAELIATAGKAGGVTAAPEPPAEPDRPVRAEPPAEGAAEPRSAAEPVPPASEPAMPPASEPAMPPASEPAMPPASEPAIPPASEPAVPPTSEPPSRRPPHRRERMHALAALDLLYSLAPDGAPRPKDPEVLRALTMYEPATAPGLATPRWFALACAAHGIPASRDGVAYEAPHLAEVRARLPETYGSGAQHIERAYVQGVLPADELLSLLPARRLLLLPYDWRRLAFAEAWRAALARRLRAELGTDPDAWLRLAATVTASEAASENPTWAQLLERAQSGASPEDRPGTSIGRPRPTTPDEAIKLLERGDHLWAWPEGTLLCLADPEVVDAVLPRLGPDAPWLLAAYLLRHDRTPRAVLDRLLTDRDHDALRVLAAQSRWMKRSGAVERLVELDDPEVDLALLRHWNPRPVVQRIVTRSRPDAGLPSLGARVLADWRAGNAARPAGGLMWLCSAEPDLVEELLEREGSRLGLGHQLLGCVRHARAWRRRPAGAARGTRRAGTLRHHRMREGPGVRRPRRRPPRPAGARTGAGEARQEAEARPARRARTRSRRVPPAGRARGLGRSRGRPRPGTAPVLAGHRPLGRRP
jgi:hypothetical protein